CAFAIKVFKSISSLKNRSFCVLAIRDGQHVSPVFNSFPGQRSLLMQRLLYLGAFHLSIIFKTKIRQNP
ncbi:MAG: hypothetical protein IKR36_06225, partial [Clostridia bacterium]|nr:hypothetical protein [Clostridia bacterium]